MKKGNITEKLCVMYVDSEARCLSRKDNPYPNLVSELEKNCNIGAVATLLTTNFGNNYLKDPAIILVGDIDDIGKGLDFLVENFRFPDKVLKPNAKIYCPIDNYQRLKLTSKEGFYLFIDKCDENDLIFVYNWLTPYSYVKK